MTTEALLHPFLILAIGMAAVLVGIIVFRLNAFIALILSALIVSFLAPGDLAVKVTRVAEAFGRTTGSIGIIIALAAIIGNAMMESGSAARIVQSLLDWLGEKRAPTALATSGFLVGIPVFFDTVFYLLVPLARSMYASTGRNYLRYVLAICAGGVAAHTLVPPTPGPLVVASTLGIDVGVMVIMGLCVGIPATAVGMLFAAWINRRMPITIRTDTDVAAATQITATYTGPSLLAALAPILIPVVLISGNTIVTSLAGTAATDSIWTTLRPITSTLGNANLALLIAAAVSLMVYARQRQPSRVAMAGLVESALMSAGLIILITAAGGALGAMLQEAQIGAEVERMFGGGANGLMILFLAFGVSSLMKIAQGSSTVAMITASAMLLAMVGDGSSLPFHIVYVGTAIAGGSLVCSWMNDSGFWVVGRMSGMTEVETLKSWTPLLVVVGCTSMIMTVILATFVPLR